MESGDSDGRFSRVALLRELRRARARRRASSGRVRAETTTKRARRGTLRASVRGPVRTRRRGHLWLAGSIWSRLQGTRVVVLVVQTPRMKTGLTGQRALHRCVRLGKGVSNMISLGTHSSRLARRLTACRSDWLVLQRSESFPPRRVVRPVNVGSARRLLPDLRLSGRCSACCSTPRDSCGRGGDERRRSTPVPLLLLPEEPRREEGQHERFETSSGCTHGPLLESASSQTSRR